MNGPLTGTEVNLSGRMAVVTKSPLTNTITDSHHGGWSAARLRWAGFDGLIFKGKASKPVYAFVTEAKVEILDASELWGKGVLETIKYFQEKYGERDLSVIAIGQAGEKLNLFANWMNEHDRSSGRGGTGCVGGSKLLKAIVIQAKKKMPKAVNKELWKEAHAKALAELSDTRVITSPRKGGLSVDHPSRDYLWILARTRTLDPAVYETLLARIEAQGYDLERLDRTPQPPAS